MRYIGELTSARSHHGGGLDSWEAERVCGLPRIAVLVKSGSEMADPDVNELEKFMALSGAAQGLFVSWIGFTDAAKKEASRLFHQAKFWDVTVIVRELESNYEKISDELKSEFPLKRIWILGQKKPDRSARFAWQLGDVEIHQVAKHKEN
jgi:restriction system protein